MKQIEGKYLQIDMNLRRATLLVIRDALRVLHIEMPVDIGGNSKLTPQKWFKVRFLFLRIE